MRTRKEINKSIEGKSQSWHMRAVIEVLLDIRKLTIIEINSVSDEYPPLCEECGGPMKQVSDADGDDSKVPGWKYECPPCETVKQSEEALNKMNEEIKTLEDSKATTEKEAS